MRQIFVLSPAKTTGERAQLVYNPAARFDLACRLRSAEGVPLGEAFSFLSGLYFRGKATYAKAFAQPPSGVPGVLVVTSNRGLLPIEVPLNLEQLRSFSDVPIELSDERYRHPLERDANLLAKAIGPRCRVVFLGSIGTDRYVDPLLQSFGARLHFPIDFVGRGDMSRGGLLLRAAAAQSELEYASVAGANRHGRRPSKLAPRTWGYKLLDGKTELNAARSSGASR